LPYRSWFFEKIDVCSFERVAECRTCLHAGGSQRKDATGVES
jgi:hypothetical protein